MSGPLDRLRANVTGVAATLVTGIWLAAMFTGQEWWLPFMLVGYVVVVPLVALLFGDEDEIREWWGDDAEESARQDESEEDPLQTLRDRYARGELTDEQFEQKLERLLETETIEDVEQYRRRARTEREHE